LIIDKKKEKISRHLDANQALVDREGSSKTIICLSLHSCLYPYHLNQRSRSPCRWFAPLFHHLN